MASTVAVLIALHIRFPKGPTGQGTYLAATIGAAILALTGLCRRRGDRPWRWLAAAVALSALADAIYTAYSALFHRASPDMSWADPPWLLSYVALGAGISGIMGLRGSRHYRNTDAALDMAGAAIVGLLAVWVFALEPTMSDSSTALGTRLLWSAYPVLDVAMVAVVIGSMLVVRRRSLSTILLCSGVGCWLVSDFGFVIVGTTTLDLTVWLDVGWMVGAPLLGLAVWERKSSPARNDDRSTAGTSGRGRLAVGVAPLLVPSALEVWAFIHGRDINPWPLALATAALAYLAFLRCARFVRAKERAALEVDASERYYRTLAMNSSDAVLVVSRTGEILRESPTFARLASLQEPIVGMDVTLLPLIADPEMLRDIFVKASLAPGQPISGELLVRDASECEQWLALRVMDMVDEDNIGGLVVNLQDITERKLMEEELRNQAFHDSLTGLANRALFRDRVGHLLESRGRTGVDPAVAFLDLDEFKYVNDTMGHDAGDRLLKTIADRLLLLVRPGDTVARLGGDEFAILIQSRDAGADAIGVAERVLAALREPIDIGGRSLLSSCSIGIAHADERSDTSSLLRHADMAMYEAKANGKDRWALYDPAMGEASRERMDLEGELHEALRDGQFEVVYQPIVTISSGRLSGFEALLRWAHPTIGPIEPDRFVPILEGNGHIVEVGAWVLEEACRTAVTWTDAQPSAPRLSMAVNVSSVQLADPTFVDLVEEVLRRTGLAPASLVLEITETSLIKDPATATRRLKELHALGVKLAIDDFGTGYSSLSYLHQFPTDILKIDRSFIQTIELNKPIPALVRGILDLAHTLGIETLAEGIEAPHQLIKLRKALCDKGQGYLFSKPLSAGDAGRLIVEQESCARDPSELQPRKPPTVHKPRPHRDSVARMPTAAGRR